MGEVPTSASGRDEMLRRLVAHVRANGLTADCSLRQLAQELGTSHRMLAYYFGSRDGLLATVLTTMRAEDRQVVASTAHSWGLRDAALAMWSYFSDPARAQEHRAFFSVFPLALQDPPRYREFLDSLRDWSSLATELGIAEGLEPQRAEQVATLLVGAVRGLLIDRLSSSEAERADAAFELLLDELLPAQAQVG